MVSGWPLALQPCYSWPCGGYEDAPPPACCRYVAVVHRRESQHEANRLVTIMSQISKGGAVVLSRPQVGSVLRQLPKGVNPKQYKRFSVVLYKL